MDLSQHYLEKLEKDYELLKKLEDAHRLEGDPRQREKFKREIDELEGQIREYHDRLESLQNSSQKQIDVEESVEKASLLMVDASKLEDLKTALDLVPSVVNSKKILESEQSKLRRKIRRKDSLSKDEEARLEKKGLSVEEKSELVAKDINISSGLVAGFIASEPIPKSAFLKISSHLNFDWHELLNLDFLETLVFIIPRVRNQRYSKIQDLCGKLQILDISRPIDLDDLFVRVNILDEPARYATLDLTDFPQIYNPKTGEFDRLGLGRSRESGVPGLQAVDKYQKLMVLGKPGAGKSTFLKHVSVECNRGRFQSDRVPIFIRLKSFAENAKDSKEKNLFNYLEREFELCGVGQEYLEKILKYGRGLVLLDGLDEISDKSDNEIIKGIKDFREKYYKNQYIITCRIAAYELMLPGFTHVEVANFNQDQIESFAKKWFIAVHKLSQDEGEKKARQFIEKLNLSKNRPIRELAVTPILLILTCLVFQTKADFPSDRAELYKQGLDILLVRWDEARGISRDGIYRFLSLSDKKDLLSYVASVTFEHNEYFFKAEKIQKHIVEYLLRTNKKNQKPEKLSDDAKIILRSIETQHGLLVERAWGIYSFSHLTFQEYFTAKDFAVKLVSSHDVQSLINFVGYRKETRWQEVFLLVLGILTGRDYLCVKQKIDSMIEADRDLQKFVIWLKQKSDVKGMFYEPFSIRSLYFDFFFDLQDEVRSFQLASNLEFSHALTSSADEALVKAVNLSANRILRRDESIAIDCALTLLLSRATSPQFQDDLGQDLGTALRDGFARVYRVSSLARDFSSQLRILEKEIPERDQFCFWWERSRQYWVQQLVSTIVHYRNIGHEWNFSEEQEKVLKEYYDANESLMICINSSSRVSSELRDEIGADLLLPCSH